MSILIGITNTEAFYPNYNQWINSFFNDIKVVRLTQKNRSKIRVCNGVVFSGGVDTHPRFYGSESVHYPNAPESFNEARDVMELELMHFALSNKMPILAICRGMQLLNIHLGGDMMQDLEASGKSNHRKNGDTDRMHEIKVTSDSLLHKISGLESGMVNSAHHQGIDKLAKSLMINAISPDGVPEGLEWKYKNQRGFLLGVQWHPERLNDGSTKNPFSSNIGAAFLKAARNYN